MKKKLEAWWMWLAIDIISTYMYFVKDVKLYSLLYFVFCIICLIIYVNMYLSNEQFATIIKSKSTPATFDKMYREAKQQGISQMEKLANQNWALVYNFLGTKALHQKDTLKCVNYWIISGIPLK
jgi:hypothetical protein